MAITQMGGIKVTRARPKIRVTIVNSINEITTAELFLSRVGTKVEFAAYESILINEDSATFQFDSLLWDTGAGRYLARMQINGVDYMTFYIQFEEETQVVLSHD